MPLSIALWLFVPFFAGVVVGLFISSYHDLLAGMFESIQDRDIRKKKDISYQLFDDAENEN